jgi:hypothetical protein
VEPPDDNRLQATSLKANIRPGLSGTNTELFDESIGDKEKKLNNAEATVLPQTFNTSTKGQNVFTGNVV